MGNQKPGIRVKIQVTWGYLISLSVTMFFIGLLCGFVIVR